MSRAQQFRKLAARRPTADVDPEDDLSTHRRAHDSQDEDDSDDSEQERQQTRRAREHYVAVGESKLRQKQVPLKELGPRYTGAAVSRGQLDSASDEGDSASEDEGDSASEDGLDDEDLYGSQGDESERNDADSDSGSDQEDSADEALRRRPPVHTLENQAELQSLLQASSSALQKNLASSSVSEARKGQAVLAQRKVFDALLNGRIRMQHALIASNSLLLQPSLADMPQKEQAQEAALELLSLTSTLLSSLAPSSSTGTETKETPRKRKAGDASTDSLWAEMQAGQISLAVKRRATLKHWSDRTASTRVSSGVSLMNGAAARDSVLDSVDGSLLEKDKLVQRAKIARSCAPLQASSPLSISTSTTNGDFAANGGQTTNGDPATNGSQTANRKDTDRNARGASARRGGSVYDDSEFYSLLLKTLLSQHASTASAVAASIDPSSLRLAKQKRADLDVRASKGRKLKYVVHDKLVGFMAPEHRGSWEDRRRDELFAGLFGLGPTMPAENAADAADAAEGEQEPAGKGLRLFR